MQHLGVHVVSCPCIRPSQDGFEPVYSTPRQYGKRNKYKRRVETIHMTGPIERGLWHFTRLHNGPGLYEWRFSTKVKMPQATEWKNKKCMVKKKVVAPESSIKFEVQSMSSLDFAESMGTRVCLPQWWHPWADRSILVQK
jgi:hypothetical protein